MLEDFTLISVKYAYSLKELTQEERKLLLQYIQYDIGVEDNYDFFEGDDWMTDTVVVYKWQWKDKILLDIFGYPGDNENGCIYLDDEIVIINDDMDLVATDLCPEELKDTIDDLIHLRPNGPDLTCEEGHAHCLVSNNKYRQLLKID